MALMEAELAKFNALEVEAAAKAALSSAEAALSSPAIEAADTAKGAPETGAGGEAVAEMVGARNP